MKNLKISLLLIAILNLSACGDNLLDDGSLVTINGFVQKGPFINGTSISIYELNNKLNQTGKNYNTQINDNSGNFEIVDILLRSDYVLLQADGFYFNEVSGETSNSRLNLFAISDISGVETLNVNILSHLIKDRVLTLIDDKIDFDEAKEQAEQEILQIFKFDKADLANSESLNIAEDGDDNAILLAISVILQGERSDSQLSELLATIITDMKTDGLLDNTDIQSELLRTATTLKLGDIRSNLLNRYKDLGMTPTIPEFEKYVNIFIDSADYVSESGILYPKTSTYGENILFEGLTDVTASTGYSMAATMEQGSNVKIKLSGGRWYYQAFPNSPVNWSIGEYKDSDYTQVFTSTQGSENCDLIIEFQPLPNQYSDSAQAPSNFGDTITIEYFENYSELPQITKKLAIVN